MEKECDVVVIGGGIAGLRTAMLLEKNGVEVIVLEARDRVGGRTKGEIINGVQFDVGGQWVGPTQKRMLALCNELNLQLTPQFCDGLHVSHLNGKTARNLTKEIPGIVPYYQLPFLLLLELQIDYLARQVPLDAPWEAARAEEWDNLSVEAWLRDHCRLKTLRVVFDVIIWALLCTEPARVSFLWFLWFVRSAGGLNALIRTKNGAQQDKIKGGAVSVSQMMLQRLGDQVVHFNAAVNHIEYDDQKVIVSTIGDRIKVKCKRAVIACPPVLASRIRYTPPMPAIRDALTQAMPMGHVIKAVVFYRFPFWRTEGRSGESTSDLSIRLTFDASFISDDAAHAALLERYSNHFERIQSDEEEEMDGRFRVSDEEAKAGNVYAIAAFFLGDEAIKWAERSPADRRFAIEEHLYLLFSSSLAFESTDYIEGNWVGEEWSRGGYMGVPAPSVLTRFGDALRSPIGRLHFAGTETATQWSGYMDGALQSAERVVDEIVPLIAREVESDLLSDHPSHDEIEDERSPVSENKEAIEALQLRSTPRFNVLRKRRWQVADRSFVFSRLLLSSVVFSSLGYLAYRYFTWPKPVQRLPPPVVDFDPSNPLVDVLSSAYSLLHQ